MRCVSMKMLMGCSARSCLLISIKTHSKITVVRYVLQIKGTTRWAFLFVFNPPSYSALWRSLSARAGRWECPGCLQPSLVLCLYFLCVNQVSSGLIPCLQFKLMKHFEPCLVTELSRQVGYSSTAWQNKCNNKYHFGLLETKVGVW